MSSVVWMKALSLAGRIILENGGETYRAEDTVVRMGEALGLREIEVFGVPSGLFISFEDEQGQRESSVSRIRPQGTHLRRVDEVNRISRELAACSYAPEELLNRLKEAARLGPIVPTWCLPLTAGVSSAGFTAMFGGGLVDMAVVFLCAGVTQALSQLWRRVRHSAIVTTLLGSFLCTLLPLCFVQWIATGNSDAMVAGALMPLLPGLAMTKAVQDALRSDMVSAVAHATQAIVTAALIAGGALVAHHLMALVTGGMVG